jgi:hypothetical protein
MLILVELYSSYLYSLDGLCWLVLILNQHVIFYNWDVLIKSKTHFKTQSLNQFFFNENVVKIVLYNIFFQLYYIIFIYYVHYLINNYIYIYQYSDLLIICEKYEYIIST